MGALTCLMSCTSLPGQMWTMTAMFVDTAPLEPSPLVFRRASLTGPRVRASWWQLDLAIATAQKAPNELWRNEGHFKFTKITGTPVTDGTTLVSSSVAFGDYDGDGNQDLLVGIRPSTLTQNSGEGMNALYRGDGTGGFTQVTSTPLSGDPHDVSTSGHTTKVAWADFNNDGHLDAIEGNEQVLGETRCSSKICAPHAHATLHMSNAGARIGHSHLAHHHVGSRESRGRHLHDLFGKPGPLRGRGYLHSPVGVAVHYTRC